MRFLFEPLAEAHYRFVDALQGKPEMVLSVALIGYAVFLVWASINAPVEMKAVLLAWAILP